MKLIARRLLTLLMLSSIGVTSVAHAWDATGHRLSAYVAWAMLPVETRNAMVELIKSHPRYQKDFAGVMPAAVMLADKEEQARWLIGQAAVWPDITRGFDGEDAAHYNHPTWHYIDGAWVRDIGIQGNVYAGTETLPTIHDGSDGHITEQQEATNIVLALEYNLGVLNNRLSTSPQKAVALCWVLHLVGDIHQPLHSGSLISNTLFATGDRGGNGIPTPGGTLHSTWDEALRSMPFDDVLQRMTLTALQTDMTLVNVVPTAWLDESRRLLQEFVYTDDMKAAVLRSERLDTSMPSITLDDEYTRLMLDTAEERVTQAGIRLSLILQAIMAK